MFAFLFRFLGLCLIAAATVAFVADGARSIAAGTLVTTALGKTWYSISPATLNLAQAGVERHVSPFLWDPVILSILQLPTWLPLLVLGALFGLVGTRRSRAEDVLDAA